MAVLAIAVLVACDGKLVAPPEEEPPLPTSCADPGGTEHSGLIHGGEWAAADGPHRVTDSVNVGVLTIEAGALVCAAPGAMIVANRLIAEGTADLPITFTARDTTSPWGGIVAQRLESRITLAHVRLEHALQGVLAGISGGRTSIRNSVVRQIQGRGIAILEDSYGELIETVVDSACLTTCGDSEAAVQVGGLTIVFHFEDSSILNSGAGGMRIAGLSRVKLLGGSIEGSSGTGLFLAPSENRQVTLEEVRPIRITGGASYPAELTAGHAATLLHTDEAHRGWLGNDRDTVLVHMYGSFGVDSVTVRPGIAWIVYGIFYGSSISALHLEAGASLTVYDMVKVTRLTSSGTATEPVTIIGRQQPGATSTYRSWLHLFGTASDTSRMKHTRITDVRLDGGAWRREAPLLLEDVTAEHSHISLGGPGSRITRTTLSGVRDDFDATLVIAAPDATVSACEVTGSTADGVHVEVAEGVTIHDCNIHDNAGVGIRNVAAEPVDARNNWWGSVDGPFGAGGDGVAGDVVFEPFRTEPAAHGGTAAFIQRLSNGGTHTAAFILR